MSAFADWCPPSTAESYDNVGLQLGAPEAAVARAVVALDLTPAVVEEAVRENAQLVVTHHPPIFKPLRSVRGDDLVGGMLLRLARENISVYAAHTNLDAARGGVSFALAHALELEDPTLLEPQTNQLVKLLTFVPDEALAQVHEALAAAGAGRIGDYEACAFTSDGTGHFRPTEGTNPHTGEAGRLERVREVKLEMEVERARLAGAIEAMKAAHPYEEVAFDVVSLEKPSTRTGMGVVGRLRSPMVLTEFVAFTARRLESGSIRYSGDPEATVRKVGVCGGAGSSLLPAAVAAGADALVTGDTTYHRHFEAMAADGSFGLALVDAGHYETERPAEARIVEEMSRRVPDVEWLRTTVRTSPIHTYP